jgi:hypothetical protein
LPKGRTVINIGQLTACEQIPSWEANISQLVKKFPTFYELAGLLRHFQVPVTCPYPDPDQSSPFPHATFWRSILIISSHLWRSLINGLFLQASPPQSCIHLSHPHTWYMSSPSHSSRLDQ